jgi:protein-S-isoprenylcysteine O-methyltransferase Ste14
MASWDSIAQKIRVPVGRVGIIALFFMHPTWRSVAIGSIVAGLGALIRLWAAGHIDKGKALATAGPYALTRNPLYLGSLLMGVGVFIAGQIYWLLLSFAILYVALYFPVMKREEKDLLQGYGNEFLEYSKRVPMFLPRFQSAGGHASSFLWSRVRRNREHRHLLVLALAEIFLIIRIYF